MTGALTVAHAPHRSELTGALHEKHRLLPAQYGDFIAPAAFGALKTFLWVALTCSESLAARGGLTLRGARREGACKDASGNTRAYYRRGRLSWLASVRAARGQCKRGLRRQFLHRRAAQHRASARPPAFRAAASPRDVSALYRRGRDLYPRLPRLPGALSARPRANHQDQRARRDQHAGPRQAPARQDPAGFDFGSLRRPRSPPAAGEILGTGQPDRSALVLRRGQALRRDAILRLLAPAPAAHQGGAHLQYLWSAHAPQ